MHRFKQIDVLRAIAVLLVLGRHMAPCPSNSSRFLNYLTSVWGQGGWIGVDLFFVLSGFLVSGLLFREYEKSHELRIGRFLIRRGFKIYPPFWLLIGFSVILQILRQQHVPLRALASELLFVQNYRHAIWNHTWSLAAEEHFYFLLAFGFFVLASLRPAQPFRLVPAAFIAIAVLSLMLRIVGAFDSTYDNRTHLFASHLRLDGFFFGVLLSYAFHRHPIRFLSFAQQYRYLLAGMGVLLFLPAFCFPVERTPFIFTYGLTLFYLGSGCLLVSALGWPTPQTGLANAVAYVGSHSYSVYLWHMPVAIGVAAVISRLFSQQANWFVYSTTYSTTYLVGSIAFGVSMAILIEVPVLRIRDRLFPSRGTPLSRGATEVTNAPLATVSPVATRALLGSHTAESAPTPLVAAH